MSKCRIAAFSLFNPGRYAAAAMLCLLGLAFGCSGVQPSRPHPLAVAQSLLSQVQMAQLGPVASGVVEEGGAQSHSLTVSAERCYAVVVTGEYPLADIAVSAADAEGKVVAQDMMDGSVAMVQFCPEKSGEIDLRVHAVSGEGVYRYGLFAALPADGDASLLLPSRGDGTCQSPYRLIDGKLYTGDTTGIRPLLSTSCSSADGPESVFAVDLEETATLVIATNTPFDRMLTVTPVCGDLTEELFCNSESRGSRTVKTPPLSPGRYYVILDGRNVGDMGPFTMTVRREVQPSPEEACAAANPLSFNEKIQGSTKKSSTVFRGSCARRQDAPEDIYSFNVAEPSRFRVGSNAQFDPLIYLRKSCADSTDEIFCVDDHIAAALLSPGDYSLFFDGDDDDEFGDYELQAELLPVQQVGVPNDDLATAASISTGADGEARLSQDTFRATDNLSASCGGSGSPDVVYRFESQHRTGVEIDARSRRYQGIYYILKAEGERTAEIHCSENLLRQDYSGVWEKGTYYLVIDGKGETDFGASEIEFRTRDLVEVDKACRKAAPIRLGQKRTGALAAAGRFKSVSGTGSGGRDAVYKLVIPRATRVGILLEAAFDGYLYLTSDCPGGQEIALNDDYQNAMTSYVEETLSPGTYYVYVDSRRDRTKSATFTLSVDKK